MTVMPTAAATEPAPREPGSRRTRWWGVLALVITALVFLIPLYLFVSTAFKTNADINSWPMRLIPRSLTLENFVNAWTLAPFDQFLINSVVVAAIGTVLKVVLAISTAYAFAFLPFPGKRYLFIFMLGALMVPGHVTLLVNYITVGQMNLLNTYAGLILPGVASAFGTFLLHQFFRSLPYEVLEAAQLDGAGHLRRIFSVIMPMARPAIITVGLIALIDEWNGFVWPLIVTNSVNMRTLPIGLLYLKENDGINDWGALMAGTLFVVLPVAIVFLLAQRYIVAGLAGSAVRR
ncbi:carbohydrate ABC transporter permease [Nonomuraea fuscirosea]|jgi:ABC-type glycerol-3-phosphate transport system permease component|uniref:Carbohydrate ABC transporter membrane protein 2 (CUT1 family) n=1 Tax=Nonomuraea fuscirosea TaxID=1291556 RepID=A0A2T0MXW9_9ACTN|nr:carbohydrate ABC transporter permease [Nonomuraea fuscirosea]PRX64083.1 carbohydrate ABC transporter membrane protein 2 (CUT1 family) [Nonomuraea fuscirosea]WSA48534.1 carbohydrate ABC transporter permease [Nonomuraea fuscirosea]